MLVLLVTWKKLLSIENLIWMILRYSSVNCRLRQFQWKPYGLTSIFSGVLHKRTAIWNWPFDLDRYSKMFVDASLNGTRDFIDRLPSPFSIIKDHSTKQIEAGNHWRWLPFSFGLTAKHSCFVEVVWLISRHWLWLGISSRYSGLLCQLWWYKFISHISRWQTAKGNKIQRWGFLRQAKVTINEILARYFCSWVLSSQPLNFSWKWSD